MEQNNSDFQQRGRSSEKRPRGRPEEQVPIPDVQAPDSSDSSSSSSSTDSSESRPKFDVQKALKRKLSWIKDNWRWGQIKHAVRCAVAAWSATLLFVIPKVELWIGQAAFLILIASFLSPPSDPFVSVLERELLILLFVALAWAWSCLGIKFAEMARTVIDHNATPDRILSGVYIEAAPSVVIGAFIGIGSVFLLYVKARQGPGPYLFACIFGCICLDITLTTSVFYPYANYRLGQAIFVPLALHSCLALLASIFVFPHTISAQFTTRLQAVVSPLITAFEMQKTLLEEIPGSSTFADLSETARATTAKSEAGLIAVAAAGRLLDNDLIYCRFAPEDFCRFHHIVRRLTGRAHGLGTYFSLIDPDCETFPTHSVPHTPAPGTPTIASRHHSPERDSPQPQSPHLGPGLTPVTSALSSFSRTQSRSASGTNLAGLVAPLSPQIRHAHFPHLLHSSLINLSLRSRHRHSEHAVGVFESQRYLNLEGKRLYDPKHEMHTLNAMELLRECCDVLLDQCHSGLTVFRDWLGTVREGRFSFLHRRERRKIRDERLENIVRVREALSQALDEFRNDLRMKVLEPYRSAFDNGRSSTPDTDEDYHIQHHELPPHRHLFRCYVYQYHLMQIAEILIEALDEIIRLEKERLHCKLWTPAKHLFTWNPHDVPESLENNDDDDPDVIQGMHPVTEDDLGLPKRRDPDALPPRNMFESFMNWAYYVINDLWNGNSLFAIKAGVISILLCLPFLIKNSAPWAYRNRWAWAVVMGQLTLARFRGDTTFGLFARVTATFGGGLIGMTMWYISTGLGHGNPYGLAIVCAVCFPFFFFVRLYCPIPPMTNIVLFLTALLVVGYSYQNEIQPAAGNVGHGWDVAWRRFVLVTVGVVAAFLSSLLPPTMTLRRYQRHLLSTTSNELGGIYCSIVSYANEKTDRGVQEIVQSLIATRSKLNRSDTLTTNIIYEFSLRGRWPRRRYQRILELQVAISYSLSHLTSVLKHMEPAWTRAFLRRARLLDPDFQGDVLAVLTMISTSLRTGLPLPQITPCPLLDRFTMRHQGLEVIHRDAEEDYGLPRSLTLETMQNEQYMIFCVGIATAYGIMNRLDRLMVAAKEIVGEQYHIHGVGIGMSGGLGPKITGVALSRPSTKHFQPPGKEV